VQSGKGAKRQRSKRAKEQTGKGSNRQRSKRAKELSGDEAIKPAAVAVTDIGN
jgi:hypothetical protein